MRQLGYTSQQAMASSRRWVFGAMAGLLGIGLVMAYSADVVEQMDKGRDLAFLRSELLQVGVALSGFLVAMRVRPVHLYQLARPAWLLGVVLLIVVLAVADEVNGSRRWLSLGGMSFQPSELARVGTIVMIAAWMAAARDRVQQFTTGLLIPFGMALVPAALIIVEPDLGSATFLLFMGGLVLWVGGARPLHLGSMFLAALAGGAAYGWTRLGHVQGRVEDFMNPSASSQVGQGLTALGHGGLTGTGLGAGVSKWGFLPEAESDFVLAVIGEELGLLGTGLVLLLYGVFLWHGVRLLLGLRSRFALVAGTGLLMQVLVQAMVNVAVVAAAVPPKGVPLPFVSSGGSSRLFLCISVGLLLGLARRPEEDPVRDAQWASSLTRQGEPAG